MVIAYNGHQDGRTSDIMVVQKLSPFFTQITCLPHQCYLQVTLTSTSFAYCKQPLLLVQATGLWPNTTLLFCLLLYLLSLGVSAVHCQAYITTTTRLEIRLQHRTSSSTICNLSLYRRHLAITRLWNTLLGELEDTALGERCRIYRRGSYMEYSTGGARNSYYLQSFTLGRPVFWGSVENRVPPCLQDSESCQARARAAVGPATLVCGHIVS